MGKIKINLDAIKKAETPLKTTSYENKEKIEVNSTIKKQESPPVIEETKNIKNNKISLSSIKKQEIDVKEDIVKVANTKIKPERKNIDKIKEQKPIFENYESVFKKDKTSILDHIKKLKQMPKTNIALLVTLITLTITGIGFLFTTNPEVHNINNYKTSILEAYKRISENDTGSGIIQNKNTWKEINKGGYIYNIEIEKVLGKNVYIYNGKYYESEKRLNIVLDKETANRKKIKLVKILKNSFSK